MSKRTGCGAATPHPGGLVAFLVIVAGLPVANIGGPFWGLVFGVGARACCSNAWILEADAAARGAPMKIVI